MLKTEKEKSGKKRKYQESEICEIELRQKQNLKNTLKIQD